MANDRLTAYNSIVLDMPRPKYLYTRNDKSLREIFVYGKYYWDTQKPNLLKCRLDGSIMVNAVYVNTTLIMCNITSKSVPSSTSIEVFIDTMISSINSVQVYFLNPPTITAVNTTWFYYNLQDRAFV